MNLIVAVDDDWAIGKKNDLLYNLPEDMKYFRETTNEKVVIMGDNTIRSLPGGKPLKNRTTIVMTLDKTFKVDGAKHICHSVNELGSVLKNYNDNDVFVCGGAGIYKLLLPYTKFAYITKIHASTKDAEVFFPNLDTLNNWTQIKTSGIMNNGTYKYEFTIYENKNVKHI